MTRERIRARPRSFYLQAIAWIRAVTTPDADGRALMTGYQSGVVFENLWCALWHE